MPYVNVFECIGLTRATDSAVLVSARGEVTTIPVSNVPAALHVWRPTASASGSGLRTCTCVRTSPSSGSTRIASLRRCAGCSHPTPRSPSSSGTTCRSHCEEVGQASAEVEDKSNLTPRWTQLPENEACERVLLIDRERVGPTSPTPCCKAMHVACA